MARRHTASSALRTLVAVVVVIVVGPALMAPTGDGTALGARLCDGSMASAADSARVGLVIDYGPLGGPVTTQCVPVPDRAHGFDLLRAGGHSFRLNSAGLTCGIDGLPTDGCGERTPKGYRYWAYFHSRSGSWSYASDGPAAQHLRTGDVEGWHFVEGTGRPDDPPPAGPADAAVICPAVPATVVTPTVPASPPAAPAAPGGAAANPAAVGSAGGNAVTPGGSNPVGTDTGRPLGENGVTADENLAGDTAEGEHASPVGNGSDGAVAPSVEEVAVAAAAVEPAPPGLGTVTGDDTGSGTPWAALVVGVVVVGLGVVAARRFRMEREW